MIPFFLSFLLRMSLARNLDACQPILEGRIRSLPVRRFLPLVRTPQEAPGEGATRTSLQVGASVFISAQCYENLLYREDCIARLVTDQPIQPSQSLVSSQQLPIAYESFGLAHTDASYDTLRAFTVLFSAGALLGQRSTMHYPSSSLPKKGANDFPLAP